MTHYTRHCLHLGCGEPLGNALARITAAKTSTKARKQDKRKQQKRADKNKA